MQGFVLVGGFLVMVFFFGLVLAMPVYFLWNWLIPVLFRGPEVTLFQAWGLVILCGLLFKSGGANVSKE